MKKRGFTLIELMVVIVIIGILAAIAIPKLFGMTAKAKASEVGPAAGSWSKLQAGYILETGSTGTYSQIGYSAPGATPGSGTGQTNNFNYNPGATSETSAIWEASNRQDLNSCVLGTVWSATYVNTDASKPSAKTNGCPELTPNFDKLQ